MTSIDTSCVVCRTSKHPLYACRKFRSLSAEQRMDVVRKNQLCFNSLQSGHFKPQCTSDQKCQKCRKPHHTLLHAQFNSDSETKANDGADKSGKHSSTVEVVDRPTRHNSHLLHPDPGGQRSALLMTCQIVVVTSDSYVTKARARLDCASSTSFITERSAR